MNREHAKGGLPSMVDAGVMGVRTGLEYCFAHARVAARRMAKSESGQGTVEYAILVGVLVVVAILAITVFRPKVQELWDAIASGINGL